VTPTKLWVFAALAVAFAWASRMIDATTLRYVLRF